ncbi:MAG: hypothetical protein M3376_05335, partial [Actinomycetota bacterium]|nr:hypothetical protein [Actinomycetota bacterium]
MNPLLRSLLILCAALLCGAAPAAAATQCGAIDPKTQEPVRGSLALIAEQSAPDVSFGTDANPEIINLIFKVKGCVVSDANVRPTVEAIPFKGATPIPEGVVSLSRPVADGGELSLRLAIDTDAFGPGSYAGLAEIRAPYLVTNRTPISVARSEDTMLVPLGWGALAGAAGFVVFWALSKLGKGAPTVPPQWFAFALLVACTVAAGTVYANYADQEVWVFRENWETAFFTGFAAATSGVMAGLLRLLYRNVPPLGATPAPSPSPPGRSVRTQVGRDGAGAGAGAGGELDPPGPA